MEVAFFEVLGGFFRRCFRSGFQLSSGSLRDWGCIIVGGCYSDGGGKGFFLVFGKLLCLRIGNAERK